jgi:hypothetical protein
MFLSRFHSCFSLKYHENMRNIFRSPQSLGGGQKGGCQESAARRRTKEPQRPSHFEAEQPRLSSRRPAAASGRRGYGRAIFSLPFIERNSAVQKRPFHIYYG